MIAAVLAVGLGGALGAVTRAWCTDHVGPHLPEQLPWATLGINVAACFAIGIVAHVVMDSLVQTMICVGFLGGFSTMSTMCYEAVGYFMKGDYRRCFGYLAVSYATALGATALGFAVAAALS